MPRGRYFPILMSAPVSRAPTSPGPELDELDLTESAVGPPWITVLHNCNCHTFEEVVHQLMKAIACPETEGWEIAWRVHNTGRAVVKVGAEEECVKVGNILAEIGLIVTVARS